MMRLSLTILLTTLCAAFAEPPDGKKWQLVFEDHFDYPDAQLEQNWISQNGPSGHILCSRWRENARVDGGLLSLINRKEQRGGQEWTSGSLWTRRRFKYGYFECRYRYAAATGTNNSFWLTTLHGGDKLPEGYKHFEIDVNEGHYPDRININIHNWSDFWTDADGKRRHHAWPSSVCLSPEQTRPGQAAHQILFDGPKRASKVRWSSRHPDRFHLRTLRIFPPLSSGEYPAVTSGAALPPELPDYARSANILASSGTNPDYPQYRVEHVIDGSISSSWITPYDGEKFIELDLGAERELGCVQFLTGWRRGQDGYVFYADSFKLELWRDGAWHEVAAQESTPYVPAIDLSQDFHVYALEWNEQELIFYFDGKELHRRANDLCHWPAPVYLSLAIARFAGLVSDAIDGTAMVVDYVKIWQEKNED
jgi:beta-glucanase (GH16 family)